MDDDRLIALWLYGRPAGTQRIYRAAIERLRKSLAPTPLASATLEQLQHHLASLAGMAPRSQRIATAAIRSLFAFHTRVGTLPAGNPAAALTAPKAPRDLAERILTVADVERLIAVAPEGTPRILCRLLYMSGIRAAEAVGLYWRHVIPRADGGQITVTGKGGKTRAVLLPGDFFRELSGLCSDAKPSDPVFRSPSRADRPMTYWELYGIVKRAAAAAGIKASPHWFRHSHASHSLDNGAPLSVVRDTLGHSSIAVTDAYLHARPNEGSARYLAHKPPT